MRILRRGQVKLRVERGCLDAMRRHGAQAYPEECCGFLLGAADRSSGPRTVEAVAPARNAHPDRFQRTRRHLLDPADHVRVEREARARGLEVLGFYHSHPDRPAVPSRRDAESAHPGFTYALLSVPRGLPAELAAWRFVDGAFHPEPIEEVCHPLG